MLILPKDKQLHTAREKHLENAKKMNDLRRRHTDSPLNMLKIGDDVCHEGHVLLMEKGLGGGSRLQASFHGIKNIKFRPSLFIALFRINYLSKHYDKECERNRQ